MNLTAPIRLGSDGDRGDSIASMVVERIRGSASQVFGFQLRDVQVQAGSKMLSRCVVEMETGEGKTLATVIPAAVAGKRGKNVLVATANDYLAQRDAEWMSPLYDDLGLTVASVSSQSNAQQRHQAYAANITYGTIREFGFDHLRGRLAAREGASQSTVGPLLGDLDTLIVDEVDSVLIDEARTPLVITAPTRTLDPATQSCYRWSAEVSDRFETPRDFVHMPSGGAVALTDHGRRRFLRMSMHAEMGSLTTTDILHALERAIFVNQTIHRDSHYVINENRVDLVDEYTGRAVANRSLGGGLHQAIEAREGLPLTPQSDPIARITVQDFVSKFDHLCGITATASEDRREFTAAYSLTAATIPTHAPSRRRIEPAIACRTTEEKWQRIADDVQRAISNRRPVLIGTRTVTQSEQLSRILTGRSIEHIVLNARNPKQESRIVAKAGMPSQVTVATNMAGRGTDIQLGEGVGESGGLHVIVSEPHAASRIDRQLIGRSARQGDPGSARTFVSLDDEILDQAYSPQRAMSIRDRFRDRDIDAGNARKIIAVMQRAQRVVAQQHRKGRRQLMAQESKLAESLVQLGLDPHLDPLPTL